jgi:hypothetical protein
MSLLKNQQDGSSGDPFTVAGTFNATGGFQLDGTAGASGQVLLSAGTGNTPTWGNAFVAGMIMMWSGTIATIPSGWLLCNGSSGTPDLRNKFVIGAFSDTSGVAYTTVTGTNTQTGGSKDAIVVSHTHTFSGTTSGQSANHQHDSSWGENPVNPSPFGTSGRTNAAGSSGTDNDNAGWLTNVNTTDHTHTFSGNTGTTGSSGTDANLVPYYALAFIMKA